MPDVTLLEEPIGICVTRIDDGESFGSAKQMCHIEMKDCVFDEMEDDIQ